MRNLIRNLGLSICFFLINIAISKAQFFVFYGNSKPEVKTYLFGDEKTSARGMFIENDTAYLATSKGEFVILDLKSGNSRTIFGTSDDKSEFRDLHVFHDRVLVMQTGEVGRILHLYKSHFQPQIVPLQNSGENVFWDGMDFYGSTGLLMGDPVEGGFSLMKSDDSGRTWSECEGVLKANNGEAGFAASGTNVQVLNDSTFTFVSGGTKSRFFKSENLGKTWTYIDLPFDSLESSGAFSVSFSSLKKGIVVGGDYSKPNDATLTSLYTKDGGKTWLKSKKQCDGYRSCVVSKGKKLAFACGSSGIDKSHNNGKTWKPFVKGNFIALFVKGRFLYATTPNGTILKFEIK